MKYKVTLSGRTYEVEVDNGKAMLLDEYEAVAPAAAPVAAPAAAAPADLLQRLETLELNQMHLTKRLEALQQENDALRAALEGREQA